MCGAASVLEHVVPQSTVCRMQGCYYRRSYEGSLKRVMATSRNTAETSGGGRGPRGEPCMDWGLLAIQALLEASPDRPERIQNPAS